MPTDVLSLDIQYLKGVGPMRAATLQREIEVRTVGDLLYNFPYKYVDRSRIHTVAQLADDMPQVQLRGQILDFEKEGAGTKRRLRAYFSDGTGVVELVWFKSIAYVEKAYKVNTPYLILGKPQRFGRRFSIVHPEMEKAEEADNHPTPLQPFYTVTDGMKRSGITSRTVQKLVRNAFDTLRSRIDETLPLYIITEHGLAPLHDALFTAHFPENSMALPEARRRLKFEELFYLQLDILSNAARRRQEAAGFVFTHVGDAFNGFYRYHLPFALTGAQKRVIREVRQDMRSGRQMNRLLQGDVGSGKTVVALMCCLLAIDNGFQACLMAPTEILAEQHHATLARMLDGTGIRVELLTGSVKGARRRPVLQGVRDGSVQILVGTHALIEPTVEFQNLGFVVIDEQHRFGVKQRAKLWAKNTQPPHILVMTATPIPRTLAMTVYGDLDVSVIDELPPGRKPIRTLHYGGRDLGRLYDGMRAELQQGRQVYVVYPLIEESAKSDLLALSTGYNRLCDAFPDFRVGMVHGKMKPADKDAAMQAFIRRETQILVSTTVIEVGVNVPNASVMVIEEADRFGLAQLHQLRGRVGRGADQSFCILVTHRPNLAEHTRRRIGVMCETTDGFRIAEEDMKLRGPGDIEGTAQSGLPFKLRIANLVGDSVLMAEARTEAARVLHDDPQRALPQNQVIWQQMKRLKNGVVDYSSIS
ncbi:MAG: ATP-dependent DNA helicase RecG [Bacteroidaceae bacterium]|nr:ATP-dependent DNA helicase RecG [Bacteroidaceae bacterium]